MPCCCFHRQRLTKKHGTHSVVCRSTLSCYAGDGVYGRKRRVHSDGRYVNAADGHGRLCDDVRDYELGKARLPLIFNFTGSASTSRQTSGHADGNSFFGQCPHGLDDDDDVRSAAHDTFAYP